MKRYLPWIIFFCAVIVSLSAAFYSVFGLAKLFSGAYNNVLIMAASLEFSKLAITAYLHEYWSGLGRTLRAYLTLSVVILAMITSAGIYGFLSDAYQQTAMKDKYHTEKTQLITTKKQRFESLLGELKQERSSIVNNIQVLSKSVSTDNQVQTIDKRTGKVLTNIQSTNKQGVQKQLEVENRRRDVLDGRIAMLQDSVQIYEIEIIESAAKNDAASELGPLKYVSGLTGVGMDTVVNWVLLLLIFVFDPLAITLVISALTAFEINSKENIPEQQDNSAQGEIQRNNNIVPPSIEEVESEPPKKKRGRPRGTRNKRVIPEDTEKPIILTINEDIEAELSPSKMVADPGLTPEVVEQISKSFPKKKN